MVGHPQVALIRGLRLQLGKPYSLRWALGTRAHEKFDCDPGLNASREKCEQLGCVWAVSENPGTQTGDSVFGIGTSLPASPTPPHPLAQPGR